MQLNKSPGAALFAEAVMTAGTVDVLEVTILTCRTDGGGTAADRKNPACSEEVTENSRA